jgi:S-adenosylmethionine:tRNA ribosyltransferase-isomerase
LPKHRLKKRSESRLLVIDKTAQTMTDKHFYDIIDELETGDTLVLNNTRVLPPAFMAKKPTQAVISNSSS